MRKPAVHGHRGARAHRPENTIAAFEYAIAAGADGIELDVVLTRDGVPVVSHDPVDEKPPHVPLLSEVLELANRGDFLFNIELKPFDDAAHLVGLVLALIDGLRDRVLFQSFDFAMVRELAARAPAIPRSALFEHPAGDFVAIARTAQATAVSPEFHLVSTERVRSAHEAGLEVLTWTPNHPAEWQALIEAGVDTLITDEPEGLLRYLGRR